MAPEDTRRSAAIMIVTLGLGHLASQFLRSSPAVIAPELMREMALGPEIVGLLTGSFFLTFAMAQIPVGVLLDRAGPRRTIGGLVGLAVLGAGLFASARSEEALVLARGMLGLGCAPLLTGAMVAYARQIPFDRFASVMSYTMGIGACGVLLAATPLALGMEAFGWRNVFWAAALALALIGLAVVAVVKPERKGAAELRRERLIDSVRGVGAVVRARGLLPIVPLQTVIYSVYAAVIGLWGGPYLADIHRLDPVMRGNVLLLAAFMSVIGTFAFGPLDRLLNTRKHIVLGAGGLSALALGALALADDLGVGQATLLFAIIGFCSGSHVVLMTHARSMYSVELTGRAMSFLNTLSMGGTAVMQSLAGVLIGRHVAMGEAAPLAAYHEVFLMLSGVLAASLAIYAFSQDVPPTPRSAP